MQSSTGAHGTKGPKSGNGISAIFKQKNHADNTVTREISCFYTEFQKRIHEQNERNGSTNPQNSAFSSVSTMVKFLTYTILFEAVYICYVCTIWLIILVCLKEQGHTWLSVEGQILTDKVTEQPANDA